MATKRSTAVVSSIGPVVSATQRDTPPAATKSGAPKPLAVAEKRRKNKKSQNKKSELALAGKESKAGPLLKSKKHSKPKKIKMVRDSYTMPENDYAKLAELKKACLKAGVHVKKSELLRAGLTALARLSNATLLKAVDRVVKIKTGRPGKQ